MSHGNGYALLAGILLGHGHRRHVKRRPLNTYPPGHVLRAVIGFAVLPFALWAVARHNTPAYTQWVPPPICRQVWATEAVLAHHMRDEKTPGEATRLFVELRVEARKAGCDYD